MLISVSAWPNGVDFFKDALEPGPQPLVYTGRVTDRASKPIPNTQIYVTLNRLGIAMEVHGDSSGKYKTHDVRKALDMIGEKVDTSELEIFVKRSYHKQVVPQTKKVPKQDEGVIQIDFIMERD
jgi:hypothetical protein